MTRFFLALLRLVALTLSFFLSTFCAAGFLTLALFLGGDASWLSQDPSTAIGSVAFLTLSWLSIAQLSFAPAFLLFVILEFARLSGLLTNIMLGGIVAVAALFALPTNSDAATLPYPESEIWLAAIAAGFCGGLVHWILAGHRAGRWLGPPKP